MHIVIADKNETAVHELHTLLDAIGNNGFNITEYTRIDNLAEDFNDGIADADIYYIGVSGWQEVAIRTAATIKEERPLSQIIFTVSGYRFCEECYEVEHIYCLGKPYSEDRVRKSVRKAMRVIADGLDDIFTFSISGKVHIVRLSDIMYFEKDMRKVRVHLKDGSSMEFYETMDSLIDRLTGEFRRCHNSYVVNMMHVREYSSREVILDDGEVIPISRGFRLTGRE